MKKKKTTARVLPSSFDRHAVSLISCIQIRCRRLRRIRRRRRSVQGSKRAKNRMLSFLEKIPEKQESARVAMPGIQCSIFTLGWLSIVLRSNRRRVERGGGACHCRTKSSMGYGTRAMNP